MVSNITTMNRPHLGRRTAALVAIVACLAGCGRRQDHAGAEVQGTTDVAGGEAPYGRAALGGRVTTEDGTPIRLAEISINTPGSYSRQTATDGDGRYLFPALPPGRYSVSCRKAPFVDANYGSSDPFLIGREVPLEAGRREHGIDFRLAPGGVVTGRIVDGRGEPVARVSLNVMRLQARNGEQSLAMPGSGFGLTDDRGEYRIYGLATGTYYLRATVTPLASSGPDPGTRMAFVPSYYPGVTDPDRAEPVVVSGGHETPLPSMILPLASAVGVSGRVVRGDKALKFVGLVTLQQKIKGVFGHPAFGSRHAMIEPDGWFALDDVTPGEYRLMVTTRLPGDKTRTAEDHSAEGVVVPLTVQDRDIAGLQIATSAGGSISGQIIFDPAATGLTPASIQLLAWPSDGFPVRADVTADWRFVLPVRPGSRVLMANAGGGWAVRSITRGVEDLTDRPIETTGDERWTDVRVVFSRRVTTVSGVIDDDRCRRPDRACAVMLYPADPARWQDTRWPAPPMSPIAPLSRTRRLARVDQSGRFAVSGLVPGRYLAAAVSAASEAEWPDPQTLAALAARAEPFVLADGEARALVLHLGPGLDPGSRTPGMIRPTAPD